MVDHSYDQSSLLETSHLDGSHLNLATAESPLGPVLPRSSQSAGAIAVDAPPPIDLAPAPLLGEESAVLSEVSLDAETHTAHGSTVQQDSLTGLREDSDPLVSAFIGIGCIFRVPDLTIAPEAELRSNPDGTVTVSWAVTNNRTRTQCADVAANSFFNRFWLSSDPTLDVTTDTAIPVVGGPNIDDTYYTNQQAIAAGATSAFREETLVLSGDQQYLILSVNQPQNIGESDYNNNIFVFDLQGLEQPIGATPLGDTSFNQSNNCAAEFDVDVNSRVEMHSGALTETHTLTAYQSQGRARALTLHYDSTAADVRPIVHFAYENVQDAPGTQLMIAKMSIQAGDTTIALPGYTGDQFGLTGGENFWSVPDQDNAVVQGALQADLRNQASGVYTYQVDRDIQTFDPAGTFDPLRHTTTGTFTVVNRAGSPFGNGWSLGDWQEIVVNADNSVLLIDGDGTHQIFQAPTEVGGVYGSPAGDYSRLERLADGTFRRTLKDQTVTTFNARNQLATVQDRNGNTLTYLYDTEGKLITMRDAVGLETTFTYTEGRVTTITDPAGRQTQLAYDPAGNLQSITDPDAAVRTWEYDNNFRMTAEVDQRGHRETTEYDGFGRVDRSIRRDGSVIDIDPIQVKGLYLPSQTIDPTTAPLAFTPTATEIITPTATQTDGRGNVEVFTLNKAGNLLNQTDAVGNVLTLERDCSCGRVSAMVDGTGDRTTITYDDQGNPNQIVDSLSGAAGRQQVFDSQFNQLIQATDELGRQTLHELDATGNIIEIRQVVGEVGGTDDRVTSLTYLGDGLVDTVTDALGRITNFDYDARGLVTTITTAQGTADEAVERYEYDSAGNQSAFIDARGNRTTFEYDGRNRLIEMVEADPDGDGPLTTTSTQYFYDAAGNRVRRVDGRGHETLYAYDTMNRLERITEADPDGAGPLTSPITNFGYDADGNLTTLTDARGNVTTYAYDARNRQTQVTEADPDGTGPLAAPVTQYTYDLDNNLTALTNARGVTTQFEYDARDRLIRTTSADPDGAGALPVLVTDYQYNAVDLLTQLTRPGNRTTAYQYDELNRLVEVTEPDPDGAGALTAPVTQFGYDLLGNQTQITDALGRVTNFGYDARNRLTQITDPDPDGAGPLAAPVTGYTYDAANNQTAFIDPLGRTTTFQYDGRNRLIQTTNPDPDGAGAQIAPLTRYSYDAVSNLTATSDALGQTTQYQYDALNRQIAIIDPLGQATQYGYDAVDNLVSVTDPLTNQTTYAYDGLNRLIQDTNALGFSRSYGYDAMDNLTQMSDRNGQTRQFTYDNLDRRTSEQWLSATDAVQRTLGYGFDELGRLTQVQDTDALTDTVLSLNTYSFDALDRLTSESITTAPSVPQVVFGYAYDAVDNLTQTTDTIAGTLSGTTDYTYDALDRMTQVQQGGTAVQSKRVEMGYNVASELTSLARFAGADGNTPVASTNYSYDGSGRLSQLTHATDAATIADYQLSYDAANRLTTLISPDGTATYTYDDRDQLTGADYTAQDNEAYSYDANGNRTNAGYQTGTNNQLTTDGVFNYEYDNEGNRIRRTRISDGTVTTYEWDHRQRLVAVSEGDGATVTQRVTYTYDAFDRRLSQSVDSDGDGPAAATTEHFIYDGDHIALVFDETGNQTHRYLHGPNVDQILAEETADGAVHWALTDHQGSVRDVIDNSGNILNRIVYDSFGQVTSETNPDFDFRFGYTGRERDEATGLMYYRARYYDPAVGRFLSEDPLGFNAGDANLYRYVFNSPTNYTDPSGEAAFAPLIFVGGVKAIKAAGAVLALGAVYLNNQLQSEETREALEDFAQRCLETVTGGYNPDFDPNRPIWDNLPLPQVDWGEILQTPPVNLEDLYPGGFGEESQSEVDDFDADPRSPNPELEKPFFDANGENETVTNSAGQPVIRTFVPDQDKLLEAAENAAGGSLDNYINYKPNWWESPDGKRRIEWNPDGHANTNEGPHVTVRDFNGRRHSVTEKIFIEGQETF
ncbi:RHS repeat protein [Adonisia turfae]|uniref:RHS repeat protein n=1 Tax=Adonisia turfae CCMR0081 TaxID=2292702 RepID=A0A6M0RK45_9CYAN|nr:RHS repeat protein [Adonisia turfae]NEZ56031.1 RHS repeat protein [Adonisia turfae CCMR0081]